MIGFGICQLARQADAEPEPTCFALVRMQDPKRRFRKVARDPHPGFGRAPQTCDGYRVVVGIVNGEGED